MTPKELIRLLVDRSGGATKVARAMKRPKMQPTLHRLAYGTQKPRYETAAELSSHFGIPVAAFLNEDDATKAASALEGVPVDDQTRELETVTTSNRAGWPFREHLISPDDWASLDERDRGVIESAAYEAFEKCRSAKPVGSPRKHSNK